MKGKCSGCRTVSYCDRSLDKTVLRAIARFAIGYLYDELRLYCSSIITEFVHPQVDICDHIGKI
ncbi:hypothetical protein [Nostoc sp.]|uniref:hypothetical protein n=1 Tax=Nostoc sp. TaxID=1180 RepID=UPI002FF6593E